MPLAGLRDAGDSGGLAERRLCREADRVAWWVAELRDLHRARRPGGGFPVPVLGHDLAGVRPVAEPVLALRRRRRAVVLGAGGGRVVRSALREVLPDSGSAA